MHVFSVFSLPPALPRNPLCAVRRRFLEPNGVRSHTSRFCRASVSPGSVTCGGVNEKAPSKAISCKVDSFMSAFAVRFLPCNLITVSDSEPGGGFPLHCGEDPARGPRRIVRSPIKAASSQCCSSASVRACRSKSASKCCKLHCASNMRSFSERTACGGPRLEMLGCAARRRTGVAVAPVGKTLALPRPRAFFSPGVFFSQAASKPKSNIAMPPGPIGPVPLAQVAAGFSVLLPWLRGTSFRVSFCRATSSSGQSFQTIFAQGPTTVRTQRVMSCTVAKRLIASKSGWHPCTAANVRLSTLPPFPSSSFRRAQWTSIGQ